MTSNIPGNITAPIFAFDVQSGGQFENDNRILIKGHGLSGGSLGNGEIALCNTRTDARNLVGAGSMLESMFIRLRQNAPAAEIWIGRVEDTGTAEIRSITVGVVPAAGGQGVLMIAGRRIAIEIAAGTTADALAAALSAAINAFYDRFTGMSLPYTATVLTNVVTLTARHKGTYAAGHDFHVPVLEGVNAFEGILTIAVETAGAGTPSIANVLAATNDDPFETLINPFPDTTNLDLLKAYLSEVSGRWSWSKQLYGHGWYGKTDTSSNLATFAIARDTWHLTMIARFASGGFAEPEYEWLAAQVGRVMPWLGSGSNGDVSRNQTGLVVEGLSPPRDRAYWMDYETRESLLKSGVSSWSISRGGQVQIDKLVTNHQTTSGQPDTTFRDVQRVYQLMYALKKFRADLAFEHSNKAITNSNPDNLPALVTVRDIKATLYHSYRQMSGVLENAEAALQSITVTRDVDNPNRVNVELPLDFVNALDIFAGLARVYSQFR